MSPNVTKSILTTECTYKHKNEINVSDYHLTGYSLGGTQAAFVSRLDESEQFFNFKKVLRVSFSWCSVIDFSFSLFHDTKVGTNFTQETIYPIFVSDLTFVSHCENERKQLART